jgi:hypothetical protein
MNLLANTGLKELELLKEAGLDGVDIRVKGGAVFVEVSVNGVTNSVFVCYLWDIARKIKYADRMMLRMIPAIHFVRLVTGWGLKEAKEFVDKV